MPLRPPVDPLAGRRGVADFVLENPAALVDEEEPDVRMSRILGIGQPGERQHFAGDLLLRTLNSLRDVLDYVAIVVTCPERHRRVKAAWILTEQLLGRALRFDEIFPIQTRDGAQTRD